jgi:hypothetical protein
MYLVKDISGAIGLMAVALVLLGTWPVVLAVLERRGRLPQHTFLDFSVTNFLAAVLVALTFGQIGPDTPETPNFLTQLTQVAHFPFQLILSVTFSFLSVHHSDLKKWKHACLNEYPKLWLFCSAVCQQERTSCAN